MELMYKPEHINCLNYDGGENPIIEMIDLPAGRDWELFSPQGKVLFVMDGELEFWLEMHHGDRVIKPNNMLYLPPNSHFNAKALSDTKMVLVRLLKRIQFCDYYQVENLTVDVELNEEEESSSLVETNMSLSLQIKPPLRLLLEQLFECISAGFKCTHYLDIKVKEIFFLFRAFYTKKELGSVFFKALNQDSSFSEYVHSNYGKYDTVADFARSMNYTPAGFEKHFFKTFGVSAYQWMIEQKTKNIFHEITTGNKKLKQISEDFRFSSPSAFNDFCKKYLNATPGEIRKGQRHHANK